MYGTVLLTVLAAGLGVSAGLQCYQCLSVTGSNALPDVTFKKDEACEEGTAKNLTLCDTFGSCIKISAKFTLSDGGKESECDLVQRTCSIISARDECESSSDASLVNSVITNPDIKVSNLDATGCLCSSDKCNGQTTTALAIGTLVVSLFWHCLVFCR